MVKGFGNNRSKVKRKMISQKEGEKKEEKKKKKLGSFEPLGGKFRTEGVLANMWKPILAAGNSGEKTGHNCYRSH